MSDRQFSGQAIDSFSGDYRFLSNFYPVEVEFEGQVYASTEHAYQAAKFEFAFRTPFQVISCTAGQAKKLGQTAPLPANWETRKVEVMRALIKEKFYPGTILAKRLLKTINSELIEGNTWGDTFWGVCKGHGKNMLGRLLQERRGELYILENASNRVNQKCYVVGSLPVGFVPDILSYDSVDSRILATSQPFANQAEAQKWLLESVGNTATPGWTFKVIDHEPTPNP